MQVKSFTSQAAWWLSALWHYLGYVVRHKWHVFVAGRKMGVGLWQLLVHDWSKFRPSEFLAYAWYFNSPYGKLRREQNAGKHYTPSQDDSAFALAWQLHLHRNPRHWQHWVLTDIINGGEQKCLPMPIKYIREMLADWVGAGKAQGLDDMPKWYDVNKGKIVLHPETRMVVEILVAWWKLGRPKGWRVKLPKDGA